MKCRVYQWSLMTSSALVGHAAFADFTVGGINVGFLPRLNGGGMYYEYSQASVDALAQAQQEQLQDMIPALREALSQPLEAAGLSSEPPTISDPIITAIASDSSFEVSALLPTIGGGGTVFVADRFFVDGYVQHAFEASDTTSQVQTLTTSLSGTGTISSGDFTAPFNFNGAGVDRVSTTSEVDTDRTEWSVAAGYAVTDSFSLYAGYKRAETSFEQNRRGSVVRDFTVALETPTLPDIDSRGSATRLRGTLSQNIEREFEHDGPFVGGAYGWAINKWVLDGMLTFNLAVAFLEGEVTEHVTNTTLTFEGQQPQPLSDIQSVLEGDTVGLRLGLSWRGITPIDGLSYLVGVNGYQYDFDGDKVRLSNETVDRNVDVSFDETVINFQAGLAYSF